MGSPRWLPPGGYQPIVRGCRLSQSWFWIVGGPNGSGKSTLIRNGVLDLWTGGLRALSPDDVVVLLRERHPERTEIDLLRMAQAESDGEVDRAIAEGRSVMVETVLSSPKFERRVEDAKSAGLLFGFVFVAVGSVELNVARVRHRVMRGGHDVPIERIKSRRERSLRAASWFAGLADIGVVFDNSGGQPELLAEKAQYSSWQVRSPGRLSDIGLRLLF